MRAPPRRQEGAGARNLCKDCATAASRAPGQAFPDWTRCCRTWQVVSWCASTMEACNKRAGSVFLDDAVKPGERQRRRHHREQRSNGGEKRSDLGFLALEHKLGVQRLVDFV